MSFSCSYSCSLADAMAGLPCETEQKAEFFFTRYCSVVKPTSVQQLSGLFWSYKVRREFSQGPKCTSQIWKSAVIKGGNFIYSMMLRG